MARSTFSFYHYNDRARPRIRGIQQRAPTLQTELTYLWCAYDIPFVSLLVPDVSFTLNHAGILRAVFYLAREPHFSCGRFFFGNPGLERYWQKQRAARPLSGRGLDSFFTSYRTALRSVFLSRRSDLVTACAGERSSGLRVNMSSSTLHTYVSSRRHVFQRCID